MKRFEIRWKNFRGLKDTNWVQIRPITIVVGANGTGKTSLLAPLLLLKQTFESSDTDLALKTVGSYFNAGSYENLIWSHDKSKTLELGFRFHRLIKVPGKEIDKVGEVPPGEVSFSFEYSETHEAPILRTYSVRDVYGRLMLTRTRLKSGRYSVRGIKLEKSGPGLHAVIRNSRPERFIFSAESAFRERIVEEIKAKKKPRADSDSEIKVTLTEVQDTYLSIVTYVKAYIERLLKEISYIGPLSEPPKRMYQLSGEKPGAVGVKGENFPEILYRERNDKLLNNINKWMEVFDSGSQIKCNTLSDGVFSLTLQKDKDSTEVNIADTGFGLSQVLPLVVQSYYSDSNSLIIAEQPEVHLNPRLQALLADVFCEAASRGVGIMAETHSEHLLLRLRRLIAEGKIEGKNVAIYYVEKSDDESFIKSIPVTDKGHIDPSDWPSGFFEESLKESLGLAAAQARKRG